MSGKAFGPPLQNAVAAEQDRGYRRRSPVSNGSQNLGDGTTVFQRMLVSPTLLILKQGRV